MGKDVVLIPDEVRPLLEQMADQLSEQIFRHFSPNTTGISRDSTRLQARIR